MPRCRGPFTGGLADVRRSSGEVAIARGIYHSDCKCRAELNIRRGDRFPDCPRCRKQVVWLFTRSWTDGPPAPRAEPGRDA